MKKFGSRRDLITMKSEMVEVSAFMQSLPPSERWQNIRPLLSENLAISFERKWWVIGYQLNAFFSDAEPLPSNALSETEQRFIEVYTNYYLQLGILVFQALPQIKTKFQESVGTQLGIEFPKQRSDLLKELILEDCFEAIELISKPFWESPSEKEAQQLWQIRNDYFNDIVRIDGKVKPLKELSTEEWDELDRQIIGISQKLNWPLPKTGFVQRSWNELCIEVFLDNRQKLPAYNSWVEARSQKFTVEKWQKHFWQDYQRTNYSGRGKNKRS